MRSGAAVAAHDPHRGAEPLTPAARDWLLEHDNVVQLQRGITAIAHRMCTLWFNLC